MMFLVQRLDREEKGIYVIMRQIAFIQIISALYNYNFIQESRCSNVCVDLFIL